MNDVWYFMCRPHYQELWCWSTQLGGGCPHHSWCAELVSNSHSRVAGSCCGSCDLHCQVLHSTRAGEHPTRRDLRGEGNQWYIHHPDCTGEWHQLNNPFKGISCSANEDPRVETSWIVLWHLCCVKLLKKPFVQQCSWQAYVAKTSCISYCY